MKKQQDLYISFDPEEYRKNKSSVLSSQMDLLNTLKHLDNYKKLALKKLELKANLHRLFSEILEELNSLEEKLPSPKMPKSKKEKADEEQEKKSISLIADISEDKKEKMSSIDRELEEIREKLRRLNS